MTREEAIKILKEHYDHWMRLYKEGVCTKEEGENTIEALDMAIKALEQEPKTGHWIADDIFNNDVIYRCSKCNALFRIAGGTPKDNEYNFCPKCGKRLIEPQESEDKEQE